MLAPFLDRLTGEELDAVPYGMIELDAMGTVRTYNRAELDNCGLTERPLGQNYFADVAPSANAAEFYGRFLQAIDAQEMDELFIFTYACTRLPRRVQVRLYYSKRTGSVWVFTAKPDGTPLDRAPYSVEQAMLVATIASGGHVA